MLPSTSDQIDSETDSSLISSTQSSSISTLQGESIVDPCCEMRCEVQVVQLPNYFMTSNLTASAKDQIYSKLTKECLSCFRGSTKVQEFPVEVSHPFSQTKLVNEIASTIESDYLTTNENRDDSTKSVTSYDEIEAAADTRRNTFHVDETYEPIGTQKSLTHNVAVKRVHSELEFEQISNSVKQIKSQRVNAIHSVKSVTLPSTDDETLTEESFDSSQNMFHIETEFVIERIEPVTKDLEAIKEPHSHVSNYSCELSESPTSLSTPLYGLNESLSSSSIDSRNQIKDSYHASKHQLDVSESSLRPELIFKKILSNFTIDTRSTTRTLNLLWGQFGKRCNGIGVFNSLISVNSCVSVSLWSSRPSLLSTKMIDPRPMEMMFNSLFGQFGNHKAEMNIIGKRKELASIFAANKMFDTEWSVNRLNLRRGRISFKFDCGIISRNAQLWNELIKKWINSPLSAHAVCKYTQHKYKIYVEIDALGPKLIAPSSINSISNREEDYSVTLLDDNHDSVASEPIDMEQNMINFEDEIETVEPVVDLQISPRYVALKRVHSELEFERMLNEGTPTKNKRYELNEPLNTQEQSTSSIIEQESPSPDLILSSRPSLAMTPSDNRNLAENTSSPEQDSSSLYLAHQKILYSTELINGIKSPSSLYTGDHLILDRKEDHSMELKTFSSEDDDTMTEKPVGESRNMVQVKKEIIDETYEPIGTQKSLTHNVAVKRVHSELEFEQISNAVKQIKSLKVEATHLAKSVTLSPENHSTPRTEPNVASQIMIHVEEELIIKTTEPVVTQQISPNLLTLKRVHSELESGGMPNEIIPKRSRRYEQSGRRNRSFSSVNQRRSQSSDSYCPTKHWLKVSRVSLRPELVVKKIETTATVDTRSTRKIFDTLYSRYGRHRNRIEVLDGGKCLKILTRDQRTRRIIKRELSEIFQFRDKFACELSVSFPVLQKPKIYFEFEHPITFENSFSWITSIKELNRWPPYAHVVWKYTTRTENKYKIYLEIDSMVRGFIEQADGKISIGHRRINVVDCLGLYFCYKSLRYDECLACDCPVRCCFCNGHHMPLNCRFKNFPNLWYCYLCKVRGHSPVSKDCPVLLKKIRFRLAEYDHNYKYIFFEQYNLFNADSTNAMARLC